MGNNNATILGILLIVFVITSALFLILYLDANSLVGVDSTTTGDYNELMNDCNQLQADWRGVETTLLNCYENNLEVCNYATPTWG